MKIKLLVPMVIILLMTSCTQVTVNNSDEIRMNKWTSMTENGNTASLTFKEDIAEFKVRNNNKELFRLKGLCVIDSKRLLIYNQSDSEPYFFEYIIKNNNLTLKYDGGSIKLTR